MPPDDTSATIATKNPNRKANMTRTDLIRNRIATHCLEELGVAVVTPGKETWQTFEQLKRHHRYGWMPPFSMDESEHLLVVSFCPEILADVSEWLDEDQLDTYLTVIEAFIDAYCADFQTPFEQITRAVEDTLYEKAPSALALLNEVEARATDAMLAAERD